MRVIRTLALATLTLAACTNDAPVGGTPKRDAAAAGQRDLTFIFDDVDMAGEEVDLLSGDPNACGDYDPACQENGLGPDKGSPFPLGGDMPKDPNATNDGIGRDPMGYLALDQTKASFDYLWIANSQDWSRGTVTKINSKTVREVARYFTFTCFSNPQGSKANCDGTTGCCAADDYPRHQARKAKMPLPPRQAVEQTALSPSRTAVDFNGDMFIANRAFSGQSGLTKIANDIASCKDRNKNGRIDTSTDANGNGVIDVDCNADGQPDDIDGVKAKACTNGGKQEFYGLDDECILFTTNTGNRGTYGRPLGLGPGAIDGGASDAYPGTFNDGKFFRIDGVTGIYKDEWTLPGGCQPYGLSIDQDGYGWSPNLGQGPLCYFDTRNNMNVGRARDAQGFTMNGYGTGLDRDQNIWVGGLGNADAYRYVPDRTAKFAKLGMGWWTKVSSAGSQAGASGGTYAVAADSRTNNAFFVFISTNSGHVAQIPASTLPKVKMDQTIDGSMWPAVKVAGSNTRGVGVDRDQNVWGISYSGSVATRIKVDAKGVMTPPDINSPPAGNNRCPAGDRCELKGPNSSDPAPYTYSDFTGFGLRTFTRPQGTYSYVFKGCNEDDDGLKPNRTQWYRLNYDADVPPNTTLTARLRVGPTPTPDQTWGAWTNDFDVSPVDLQNGMPLQPDDSDLYLQVEFTFKTQDKNTTPRLKSFNVAFKCVGIG